MGEPVIVQENVITFPISYFTTYLPEYEFVFTCLNPMELGWPVHRNRQWILSFAQLVIPICSDVVAILTIIMRSETMRDIFFALVRVVTMKCSVETWA